MSETITQFAYINSNMLIYCRKKAKLTIDQAAKGICLRFELEHAEMGITRLTMDQLRAIATKYKRPMTVFYLDRVPTKQDEFKDAWRDLMQKFIQKLINHYDFDSKDFFEDWY